jgi:hypothetical protein
MDQLVFLNTCDTNFALWFCRCCLWPEGFRSSNIYETVGLEGKGLQTLIGSAKKLKVIRRHFNEDFHMYEIID